MSNLDNYIEQKKEHDKNYNDIAYNAQLYLDKLLVFLNEPSYRYLSLIKEIVDYRIKNYNEIDLNFIIAPPPREVILKPFKLLNTNINIGKIFVYTLYRHLAPIKIEGNHIYSGMFLVITYNCKHYLPSNIPQTLKLTFYKTEELALEFINHLKNKNQIKYEQIERDRVCQKILDKLQLEKDKQDELQLEKDKHDEIINGQMNPNNEIIGTANDYAVNLPNKKCCTIL